MSGLPVLVSPRAAAVQEVEMHDSMVDVLIYLFENYLDGEDQPPTDQDALEDELAQAGFSTGEVAKALYWLDELARGAQIPTYHGRALGSMRVYTADECAKLDLEGRGFLLFLEQNGILDPASRELVIERALAIDHAQVSVDELKWVVLLVLLNRPGRELAFTRMEDLVYDDAFEYLH
jgi:Smg protein